MSFPITITPSKRAAGRFIEKVRRRLQKALIDAEKASGLTQADIARSIGVHRSVIHREIRGHKDITLGRVAELAWALGFKAEFELKKIESPMPGANIRREVHPPASDTGFRNNENAPLIAETLT